MDAVTNEVLLAAIKEQTSALNEFAERTNEHINELEERCGKIEEKLRSRDEEVSFAFEEHSKRIDNLYAKVNALAEEKPIKTVINADGNKEAALQRDEAYDTFEEAGFTGVSDPHSDDVARVYCLEKRHIIRRFHSFSSSLRSICFPTTRPCVSHSEEALKRTRKRLTQTLSRRQAPQ